MNRLCVIIMLLIALSAGCTDTGAQSLYETAQLEERQNNPAHAQQLYQQIIEEYPSSDYAGKARERLLHLQHRP